MNGPWLVLDQEQQHNAQWFCIEAIAPKIGCTPETLRTWVKRAVIDQGRVDGVTTNDRQRIKEIERELKKLGRANEREALGNKKWRLGSESNRRPRLCRPLHNHSATQPPGIRAFACTGGTLRALKTLKPRGNGASGIVGAGNEIRTRDPNLGKVVLYQLSYSRSEDAYISALRLPVKQSPGLCAERGNPSLRHATATAAGA